MNCEEVWKDIPGYENCYQISNKGNVKSFYNKKSDKNVIIKQSSDGAGYLKLTLYKNGMSKTYRIHRLVMKSFIGISDLQVNHIDGNKKNNNLDNLEYVTQTQNIRHAIKIGLIKQNGEFSYNAKLKDNDVYLIKYLLNNTNMSQIYIAKIFCVSKYIIYKISKGISWKHI